MALRNTLFRSSSIFAHFRNYSTEKKLVDVAVNDNTGVAVVTLQRPPVSYFIIYYYNKFVTNILCRSTA